METVEETGIRFNPIGTVTVTDDDRSWTLGRPKLRQLRYFEERLRAIQTVWSENAEKLGALAVSLEEAAKSPKGKKAEIEAGIAELRAIQARPIWEDTLPWLAEVFKQLGSEPLPEDPDDWPTWLATDVSVVIDIIKHWKSAPKAYGVNGRPEIVRPEPPGLISA